MQLGGCLTCFFRLLTLGGGGGVTMLSTSPPWRQTDTRLLLKIVMTPDAFRSRTKGPADAVAGAGEAKLSSWRIPLSVSLGILLLSVGELQISLFPVNDTMRRRRFVKTSLY